MNSDYIGLTGFQSRRTNPALRSTVIRQEMTEVVWHKIVPSELMPGETGQAHYFSPFSWLPRPGSRRQADARMSITAALPM